MDTLILLMRLGLAAVFGLAGVTKLADLPGSRTALEGFGLPKRLAAPAGIALPLVELAIALVLLPVSTSWWGALAGLVGPLHDAEHGGWFTAATSDGSPDRAAGKSAYHHAFVMLAASSGVLAGIDGAGALLEEAEAVFEERFWDDAAGGCVDRWDDAWQRADDYRGLNGTMHAVEAMLAVADVTGRTTWRERAARVADLVVDLAHAYDGRLPEHFDASWTPDLELNRDRPADPFKPFGATIGHALEWSRLLLDLEAALGPAAPASQLPTAVLLFDRAVADGWASDGAPGFVYTTDWDGRPVVRARMHWVAAEAVAAAAALHQRTGEASYDDHYRTWWHYIANHVIDLLAGSWHHELDPDNRPAASVWPATAPTSRARNSSFSVPIR